LRNEDQDTTDEFDGKKSGALSKGKRGGKGASKPKAITGSGPFDEIAKQPTKKLEGHKKAIREIAYSK